MTCRHGLTDCPRCRRHARATGLVADDLRRNSPAAVRAQRDAYSDAMHGLRGEVCRLSGELAELRRATEYVLKGLGPCGGHDHHGNCQEHFVENPCRVAELRAVLARLAGQEGR